MLLACLLCGPAPCWAQRNDVPLTNLQRAKVHLGAGDFRRAIDDCRREVDVNPSAQSYLYLAYLYQALDAYVEFLAKSDHWVVLELVYVSFVTTKTEELVDSRDVLTRISKELLQTGARQQADIAASMASKLDHGIVMSIWPQQTVWRSERPDAWWFGAPPEWKW
ncbi:hypothetical protein W02_41650 [Nitrospira sp. KM1]|nr:hypothetical protein W02_41650 [Nitrospira sp. KM1]